jgi:anti-anti-sigma factor
MTQIVQENDRTVVKPQRDIVVPATDELRQELKNVIAAGSDLTIDLTGVEIIDSTGLGLLISAHNTLKKAGKALVVTNASADLRELFRSMRLDKHFTVADA